MGYYNKSSRHLIRGLHPYTMAYISAMSVKPSFAGAILTDNFVRSLVDKGLWTKFDGFYLLASHDAQAARLNLVAPSTYALSVTGSPTFTTKSGYAGAASGYLSMGVNSDALSKFTRNDAHLGVYVEDSGLTTNAAIAGATAGQLEIRPRTSNSIRYLNNTTPQNLKAFATTNFHWLATRSNSSEINYYNEAVADGGNPLSGSSVALGADPVLFCGGINGDNTGKISIAHIGSNLTAQNITDLVAAINVYRSGIGAT